MSFQKKCHEPVEAIWEFAAFRANSLILILLGIHEAKQSISSLLLPSIVELVLVLLGRATTIYFLAKFFSNGSLKVNAKHQHVLVLNGQRGALVLALVLGLSATIPYRAEIVAVAVAFAVVVFSVVVQGLTVTPLMNYLCLVPAMPDQEITQEDQS